MYRLLLLLLLSTTLLAQYNDCATAAANPIVFSDPTMNSCNQWNSSVLSIPLGPLASSFPNSYCSGGGTPVHNYWVSFIMPPNSSTSFSMQFNLLGSCQPIDMTGLGVSVFKGSCGSFTNLSRQCGFCNSTVCRRRTVSNAQLTPGTQVFLQLFDVNEFNCNVELTIFISPSHDNCITPIPINQMLYCNRGGTNNDPITSPGQCFPKPPHNGGIFSIDNAIWFSFTVLPTDRQPYAITMKHISCISGTKAMQMLVYNTSCDCSVSLNPCLIGCTAQSEPPTSDSLMIVPGASLTPDFSTPPGNYLLAIDGGNGADCTWGFGLDPLPLSFVFAEATAQDNAALIRWLVADFKKARSFEILGSDDGVKFFSVSTLLSNSSNGLYSYTDNQVCSYYKINMTDLGGRVYFSEVISSGKKIESMEVIPSLITEDVFTIRINGESGEEIQVSVCDILGKEILNEFLMVRSLSGKIFDTHNWNRGMYQVRVSSRRGVFVKKIVVEKG